MENSHFVINTAHNNGHSDSVRLVSSLCVNRTPGCVVRLVPTLGNKEICKRHHTQMKSYITSVICTMILLIKEPSGKPIAQLNLKEVI